MEALHMDEGDQEALEVQDIPLAVQELLSDKTFLQNPKDCFYCLLAGLISPLDSH